MTPDHMAELALIDASRAQREAFAALQPTILTRWALACAVAGETKLAAELASQADERANTRKAA